MGFCNRGLFLSPFCACFRSALLVEGFRGSDTCFFGPPGFTLEFGIQRGDGLIVASLEAFRSTFIGCPSFQFFEPRLCERFFGDRCFTF